MITVTTLSHPDLPEFGAEFQRGLSKCSACFQDERAIDVLCSIQVLIVQLLPLLCISGPPHQALAVVWTICCVQPEGW